MRIAQEMFCLLMAALSIVEAHSYTLNDILEQAVKNSKQLLNVEQELRKAEAAVQEAVGSAMPLVSTSLNYSHAFDSYNPYNGKVVEPQFSMPFDIGDALKSPSNYASFSLSLTQPIYAQGKIGLGIKISKAYERTLLCKYHDEKQKFQSRIIKLFYSALLSQKNVEIQNLAVALAEETHRLTVVRQVVGKASELDTLTSRIHQENAVIDLKKAESDRKMTYETLIVEAGLVEKSSEFSVQGDFLQPDFSMTLDQALLQMEKENNTISQFKGKEEIQKHLVQLCIADFYPTIFVGGSIGMTGEFNKPDDGSYSNWGKDQKVFIGLNWNLFTGMRRNQKLEQAYADRDRYLIMEQQTKDSITLAVRNAYEQVFLSRDRLNSTLDVVSLARKGYEIAKKAYEVGSETYLDVQNAELELNKAMSASNAALFAFHSALIDLKLLIGDL